MSDIHIAGNWADTAQQELVDFVKANIAPERFFVVSLARRCGNTTVLKKLREQVSALTAVFDRDVAISDEP